MQNLLAAERQDRLEERAVPLNHRDALAAWERDHQKGRYHSNDEATAAGVLLVEIAALTTGRSLGGWRHVQAAQPLNVPVKASLPTHATHYY